MITVSIVSHNHGNMVWTLTNQLLEIELIDQIIITLNIYENIPNINNKRVFIINNLIPKGFGANHNYAFKFNQSKYFCVLNPDIILIDNPFNHLLKCFHRNRVAAVAPLIIDSNGKMQDNFRNFITPLSIIIRYYKYFKKSKKNRIQNHPHWIAGMFILFKSNIYELINGFDEKFFMYCEDTDICTRLWKNMYLIKICKSSIVVHNAQRNSHKNLTHFLWHVKSISRYLRLYLFNLPYVNSKLLKNINKFDNII